MPIDFREKNMPLEEPSVLTQPTPGSQRINNSTQRAREISIDQYVHERQIDISYHIYRCTLAPLETPT